MQLRKPCFNTTIFRKNVTGFWPIWLAYTFVWLWILPVYTWLQMDSFFVVDTLTKAEQLEMKLQNAVGSLSMAISPVPVFLFAAISGIAIFSYLYQSRSANMIHALPIRREELFLTNYISGLLFLLVPQFLAFCITVFVWFGNGATCLEYLLKWLVLVSGEAFLAYSLAVFAAMLTGQAAVAAGCFLVMNYLYHGIVSIVNAVMGMLVYGMAGKGKEAWGSWLSPLPYLQENVCLIYQKEGQELPIPELEGLDCVPWYAAAALALAASALLLYRNRDMETASDVVSVSCLKPIFRWCGGLGIAGACTYMVRESLFSDRFGNLFWFVLACSALTGLAGFFLCEMLIRKKFKVFTRKRLAEVGVFLTVLAVFLICVEADIFGIEKRMPKEEEVAGIYLDGSYRVYLEQPSEIRRCLEIHQCIVQEKKEYEKYFQAHPKMEKRPCMTWSLTYVLKTGKKLERTWQLPLDECYLEKREGAVWKLLDFENSPEKYLEYFFSSNYENLEFVEGGSFLHAGSNGDYNLQEMPKEDAEKLYQAIKEDILAGNYRIYPYEYRKRETENYADTISFSYRIPKGTRTFQDGEEFYTGKYPEYVVVPLQRGCKKTLEALQEMGYLKSGEMPMTEREYQSVLEDAEGL